MSKLFQQSNFKKKEVEINGTKLELSELSAGAMLNYTDYATDCAVEMRASAAGTPADTKDWTEADISKANKALTVFTVRSRLRLVALSLKPFFTTTQNGQHPYAGLSIEQLEEELINELKGDQLQQLEQEAKALSGIENGPPKITQGETSALS